MKSLLLAAFFSLTLTGCAVALVAGVAATAVGVAADVAVGAVKVTGKAVGAAVDLVVPDGEEEDKK